MGIYLKSDEDLMLMRDSCRLAAETLVMIEEHVKIGATTNDLDRICHDFIISNKAIPSPLNYRGFPKSICTSINNVVCHGIPDDTVLQDGDIINVDVTVFKHGFHGDTSRMFLVGDVSDERRKLVETAEECLQLGIDQVKPGNHLGDIGHAIQTLAEGRNYSVVREYCGHGIGKNFHEDPSVVHYGKPKTDRILKAGMVFTIEPMINAGVWKTQPPLADGWTVLTADGKDSAQFEHTMAVTRWGVEVMTKV